MGDHAERLHFDRARNRLVMRAGAVAYIQSHQIAHSVTNRDDASFVRMRGDVDCSDERPGTLAQWLLYLAYERLRAIVRLPGGDDFVALEVTDDLSASGAAEALSRYNIPLCPAAYCVTERLADRLRSSPQLDAHPLGVAGVPRALPLSPHYAKVHDSAARVYERLRKRCPVVVRHILHADDAPPAPSADSSRPPPREQRTCPLHRLPVELLNNVLRRLSRGERAVVSSTCRWLDDVARRSAPPATVATIAEALIRRVPVYSHRCVARGRGLHFQLQRDLLVGRAIARLCAALVFNSLPLAEVELLVDDCLILDGDSERGAARPATTLVHVCSAPHLKLSGPHVQLQDSVPIDVLRWESLPELVESAHVDLITAPEGAGAPPPWAARGGAAALRPRLRELSFVACVDRAAVSDNFDGLNADRANSKLLTDRGLLSVVAVAVNLVSVTLRLPRAVDLGRERFVQLADSGAWMLQRCTVDHGVVLEAFRRTRTLRRLRAEQLLSAGKRVMCVYERTDTREVVKRVVPIVA